MANPTASLLAAAKMLEVMTLMMTMDRVVVITLMVTMMVLWKECDKPDEIRCENKTEIKLNKVIICLIHNIRPIYFVHF